MFKVLWGFKMTKKQTEISGFKCLICLAGIACLIFLLLTSGCQTYSAGTFGRDCATNGRQTICEGICYHFCSDNETQHKQFEEYKEIALEHQIDFCIYETECKSCCGGD